MGGYSEASLAALADRRHAPTVILNLRRISQTHSQALRQRVRSFDCARKLVPLRMTIEACGSTLEWRLLNHLPGCLSTVRVRGKDLPGLRGDGQSPTGGCSVTAGWSFGDDREIHVYEVIHRGPGGVNLG